MCVLFLKPYVIKHEMTPLCVAAKYGHLRKVKKMVKRDKVKPDQPDEVAV